MAQTVPAALDGWARDVLAVLRGAEAVPTAAPSSFTTASGAVLVLVGGFVVKVHEPGTDPDTLAARLEVAAAPETSGLLLAPLHALPLDVPGDVLPDRRVASCWPRVDVLDVGTLSAPWEQAAETLARLHTTDVPEGPDVPPHGAAARLMRTVRRLTGDPTPGAAAVRAAGVRTLRDLTDPATADEPRSRLVHGDWHLGQLGRPAGTDTWLLLDLDDLGLGDPAWDLGRPAGFWAAGLLAEEHWTAFLTAYLAAGGPGVPADGDPWPWLDLPARAEVVVAAARAVRRVAEDGWDDEAEALVAACARM